MKFREFNTSSGKLVYGGKNAENNEELVKQAEKNEIVLHTKAKGSPFVNIKGKSNKEDIKDAAIFCAYYSQDWKKNHSDVVVDIFYGKDIFKNKEMSIGTFGVKKTKNIIIKKEEILKFEEKKQNG